MTFLGSIKSLTTSTIAAYKNAQAPAWRVCSVSINSLSARGDFVGDEDRVAQHGWSKERVLWFAAQIKSQDSPPLKQPEAFGPFTLVA